MMFDSYKNIGFTGSRFEGSGSMPPPQLIRLKRILKLRMKTGFIFHQGCCVDADEVATKIVFLARKMLTKDYKAIIVGHPPTNKSQIFDYTKYCDKIHKEAPYLERNKIIVDLCDELIATPNTKEEKIRSGTWSTIRYARKQTKPVKIIYPDGSIGR